MMTPAQIAAVAANAGFAGDDLITAVAVALAESNPPGNEQSVGDQGTSFGLWQIHLPAHPEFQGLDHFDPQVNAHEAFEIYSLAGDRFRDWSTYSINGRYRTFLQDASMGVAQLQMPSQIATAPTAAAADSAPTEFAAAAMPDTGVSFKQVLLVAGIGLAVLWGVEQLS